MSLDDFDARERCTHYEPSATPGIAVRCENDADDFYTFDKGQTRLCTEHGKAREQEDRQTAGFDDGREWKGYSE